MGRSLRILTVIGARPQVIKAAALSRTIREGYATRIEETILHTGQHYDPEMSGIFFDELGIPSPGIQLGVGSGDQGATTGRMIEGIERVLLQGAHDAVVIYGDTNSTLAAALAASKQHVPIAHIEAGLRSYNKAMPEEINRVVADHCSTWLFCPTATGVENLLREGFAAGSADRPTIDRPSVVNSGDVMLDNALYFSRLHRDRSGVLGALNEAPFVLVTIHRQNNTDDVGRLNAIFQGLVELRARTGLSIVLPLHPRTRERLRSSLDPELARRIELDAEFRMIPPVGYLDMLALEQHASVVVTDSGGVQKEASFFGTACVILRKETEWVELVQLGFSQLVDADSERMLSAVSTALEKPVRERPTVFGDGHAAEAICEHLISSR